MADPQKYYRLQSLAGRGMYVPNIIPFEEIQSMNQLAAFKHKNVVQQGASNLPASSKPGARTKSKDMKERPNLVPFQDMVPPEVMTNRTAYMGESQNEQLTRKGVR
jgi:hypothetical protein